MKLPLQKPYSASSAEYWTELRPDRLSTRLLLVAVGIAVALGTLLLLSAGLPRGWQSAFVLIWLCSCARELWHYLHDQVQVDSVRLYAGGRVRIALRRGEWINGRLQAGTLVLVAIAWLRIRTDAPRSLGMLLLRAPQEPGNWRRFQVIYRHIGPDS